MSMSTKKSTTSIEDKITYLHKRLARLERSSGLKVHPHPDEFDKEEDAQEEARLAEEKKKQEENKKREAARLAKEQKQKDLHAEADSTEDLTVSKSDE